MSGNLEENFDKLNVSSGAKWGDTASSGWANVTNRNRGGRGGRGGGQQQNSRGGYQQRGGPPQRSQQGYQQQRQPQGNYNQNRGNYNQSNDWKNNNNTQQPSDNGNSWSGSSQPSWGASVDNTSQGWNNDVSAKTSKPEAVSQGWNTVSSTKSNEQAPASQGWNTVTSTNSNEQAPASQGWNTVTSTNSNEQAPASQGWNTVTGTKSNEQAPASQGWNTAAKTETSQQGWGDNKTTTETISSGWSTVAKKETAPAPSWNNAAPAAAQQGGGSWNEKPKSSATGGEWGQMTMDSLGWNGSGKKPKDEKQPGRGIWKNGVHELGDEDETMRLKLFGTVDDKQVQHSGINFANYDNIPVKTTGDNVPEPLTEFDKSTLDKHLLTNIHLARYTVPTPVQKYSVPIVTSGRDLMACAQTGSGKTAGFLFPILSSMFSFGPLAEPDNSEVKQGYRSYKKAYPQALILAPTRELVSQIYEEAKKFCYRSYVRPCVAYGGADIQQQLRLIDRGCHLLVATPGRLVDILERRRLSFQNIQYLILDEADRMLDMGFEPQIRRIVNGEDMPPAGKRQTLLFSATFPENIQVLARDFLENSIFLSVGRVGATTENITQTIELMRDEEKRPRLLQILEKHNSREGLTLIFTETKRMADSVCEFLLENGFAATAIHGDRIQSEREAALDSFRTGRTPIMVATAVAARGLDIPNVTHVISYDLPNDIDDFVHRVGRTGRAGNTGYATSFFTRQNRFLAKSMCKLLKEAKQEIPGWLEEMGLNESNAPSNSNQGNYRRNNRRDDDVGLRIRW